MGLKTNIYACHYESLSFLPIVALISILKTVMKLIERFLVYYCYVSGSLFVRLIERKFILKN